MSTLLYQIQAEEIRDDGSYFYPDPQSPSVSFSQSDSMTTIEIPNADKYTTLSSQLSFYNAFELISDQLIYIAFYDSTGTTKQMETQTTYFNYLTSNDSKVIKVRNISGVTANVTFGFYG